MIVLKIWYMCVRPPLGLLTAGVHLNAFLSANLVAKTESKKAVVQIHQCIILAQYALTSKKTLSLLS